MIEYLVSAHGGRGAGTGQGTYLVPDGVEIHFYVADADYLDNSLAIPLYSELTSPGGCIRVCPSQIVRSFMTVPNYIAFGAEDQGPNADHVFKGYPTGIFRAGENTPFFPIKYGQKLYLSEIVTVVKQDSPSPSSLICLHWLCCRENMDSNKIIRPYRPSEVAPYHAWRD